VNTHEIVVRCVGYGSSGPRWETRLRDDTLGDEVLGVYREPLFQAARALLFGKGIPPGDRLQMRHDGSPIVSMSGRVGRLAEITVQDGNKQGDPSFRKWSPRSETAPTHTRPSDD
jgi:hypothetical protein